MAGLGRRTFAPGEVLTASNVMNYLQDQAVMNFADDGARGSAIGTAVSDGMVSYLQDTGAVEVYRSVGTAAAGWERIDAPLSPNYVINGGFEISQRGTSFTTSVNPTYYLDRWSATSSTALTLSQDSADTPLGFSHSAKAAWTTTTAFRFKHAFERLEVAKLKGKTVTVSAYVKKNSTYTGDLEYNVNYSNSSDSVASVGTSVISAAIFTTPAESWTRSSYNFVVPSDAVGLTIDFFAPSQVSGANLFITGVQLEEGFTATSFRRNANSLQGELAACQRYYYRTSGDSATRLSLGQAIATTAAQCTIYFPVTMRTAPTALEQSGTASHYTVTNAGGGIVTCNAVPTFGVASLNNALYSVSVASGLVAGYAVQVRLGNASGYLGFSAEL